MAKTKIEWAEHTINPIRVQGGWACTKISPGCQNCYSEAMNKRFGDGKPYDNSPKEYVLNLSVFDKLPDKPTTVFVQSMSDLFHPDVPDDFIDKVFSMMAIYTEHQFLILTKRIEQMREYFAVPSEDLWADRWTQCEEPSATVFPLPNVALGVTVESPEYLWRIEKLLQIPAAIRFVSLEPLLGDIDLTRVVDSRWEDKPYMNVLAGSIWNDEMGTYADGEKLDWLIVGPETGPHRRPCPIEWIEHIVEQCQAADVPVFVKALSINGKISKNMADWPEHLRLRQMPEGWGND